MVSSQTVNRQGGVDHNRPIHQYHVTEEGAQLVGVEQPVEPQKGRRRRVADDEELEGDGREDVDEERRLEVAAADEGEVGDEDAILVLVGEPKGGGHVDDVHQVAGVEDEVETQRHRVEGEHVEDKH